MVFFFLLGFDKWDLHMAPSRYLSKVLAESFSEKSKSIMVTEEIERNLYKKTRRKGSLKSYP